MSDVYADLKATYDSVAKDWDQTRNNELFEKSWLDRVLARCPDNPTVLYLCCGTGRPIAQYLIKNGAQITGVDFSKNMIEIAEANFPSHDWINLNIRKLKLDQVFDAVISFSALFHLKQEDQRLHFPILKEHTKQGGCVFFASGTEAGEGAGEVRGQSVYHASLDISEYRSLLVNAGFGQIEHVMNDPDCAGHTVWLASLLEK